MKEFIDAYRIANDICMNTPYQGSYLVVEGDRDYLLYNKFIDANLCELMSVQGKPNVIEVITLVNKRGNSNTLGITDSDFHIILETPLNINNLLESDYHDSEISIFLSPSLDNLINLHCQEDKIKIINKEYHEIRDFFLELVKPLAYLKLATIKNSLGLVFKPHNPDGEPPDYSKCYDNNSMKFLGIENLIKVIVNYSRNKSKEKLATVDQISVAYEAEVKNKYNLLQLCNGHDIIHIFQICLRRKLGNYDRKQYSLKHLEIQFILGFDSIHFSKTQLYQKIKSWENKKNKTVLIF